MESRETKHFQKELAPDRSNKIKIEVFFYSATISLEQLWTEHIVEPCGEGEKVTTTSTS